jgi:lipoprotein-anchoring transpeptidase ErfK/SrfK
MFSRAAVAATTALLIGLAAPAGEALAQLFPPGPPVVLPSPFRTLPPPVENDNNLPPYDPPPGYRGNAGQPPSYDEQQPLPPPGQYGAAPVYPNHGDAYSPPPQRGYEPPSPQYGAAPPPPDGNLRPPGLLPGQAAQPAQPGGRAGHDITASLPTEDRPETGPRKELPPQFRRTTVEYRSREPVGTIVVDTQNTYLYLILGNGKALRYGIGVGREGFTWKGTEKVTRMAEWPDWHPPVEMIERQPYLPRFMAGGEGNPLGARALYLGKTIYRIHGTNQPSTIGSFVSSGCIRLTNEDVIDLYYRVKVGTRVVVLPGKPPATASAAPPGAPMPSAQGAEVYGEPIPLNPPPVIQAR